MAMPGASSAGTELLRAGLQHMREVAYYLFYPSFAADLAEALAKTPARRGWRHSGFGTGPQATCARRHIEPLQEGRRPYMTVVTSDQQRDDSPADDFRAEIDQHLAR
jgi:hypothetical protein